MQVHPEYTFVTEKGQNPENLEEAETVDVLEVQSVISSMKIERGAMNLTVVDAISFL